MKVFDIMGDVVVFFFDEDFVCWLLFELVDWIDCGVEIIIMVKLFVKLKMFVVLLVVGIK